MIQQENRTSKPYNTLAKKNDGSLFFNFEGSEVRMVYIDDTPYWVAKDVATILGYSNTNDAVNKHCKHGVAKRYPIQDSLGRDQEVRVIAEPDLFRLIIGSKLPAAVEFERIVFEEILPSIRTKGFYGKDVNLIIGNVTSAYNRILSSPSSNSKTIERLNRYYIAGLTQREMGLLLNVDRSTIRGWVKILTGAGVLPSKPALLQEVNDVNFIE